MKITKFDNYGRGITYYKDKIMFVNTALPDEDVTIKNIQELPKYYIADVEKTLVNNPHRIKTKCPYYDICGGCNIMHLDDEYQEEFKLTKITEILNKYANLNLPIKLIKSDRSLFYRNKITLKIENHRWGYYNANTHDFTPVANCLLAKNSINDIVNNHEFIDIARGQIVIRTNYLDEILLFITSLEDVKLEESQIPPNIVGIVINTQVCYGKNYFIDKIGDLEFKVSYDSFFQVNNYIAENIFNILKNNITGDNLLDLYCGVGTMGIALKDNFTHIYGIELNKDAIKDAIFNAKNNGVKNALYMAGDSAQILNKLSIKFDSIVVDPPRSGLNQATKKLLLEQVPQNIAYVSCDPMTLARDLVDLSLKYEVTRVYILDMFPNTYHVESLCILKIKDN